MKATTVYVSVTTASSRNEPQSICLASRGAETLTEGLSGRGPEMNYDTSVRNSISAPVTSAGRSCCVQ